MKRRHALHKTGWILSSALFSPALVTALSGCASETNLPDEVQVFDLKQYQLVRSLGDTILPRTSSPAASEVKVPEFMDLLLIDVFDDTMREHLLSGLEAFDLDCQKATGKSFSDLTDERRYEYLVDQDRDIITGSHSEKIPFYAAFKKLCISIYYSTEAGIRENLEYRPIPGGFDGDVALDPGDIIEVGNEM